MPQNRIVTLVTAGIVILDLFWFVIRGLRNGFADKESLTRNFIFKAVGIYILAVAIIAISWFREFGILGDIVFCGCGVLAIEFENRQMLGLISDEDDTNYIG